jgi:hypothetical protein
LENPKTWMLLVSLPGAAIGIYFNSVIDPMNNYFAFMIVFAIIGAVLGNLLLLLLSNANEWLKTFDSDAQKNKTPNKSSTKSNE